MASNYSPSAPRLAPRLINKTVKITIPKGVRAGNTITVNLPNGKTVTVKVPRGMFPGNTLTVNFQQEETPTQRAPVTQGQAPAYNKDWNRRPRQQQQQQQYPVVSGVPYYNRHQPPNVYPSAPAQQPQRRQQQQQQYPVVSGVPYYNRHQPPNVYPSAPAQQPQRKWQQQYPQVMAVPANSNNRRGGNAMGRVGRETFISGMNCNFTNANDTSRDAEFARSLAALSQQQQEERRRQERADAAYAQKFADINGDGLITREEQIQFQQAQQYNRPMQSQQQQQQQQQQQESDAAMARRLAQQWGTYDG